MEYEWVELKETKKAGKMEFEQVDRMVSEMVAQMVQLQQAEMLVVMTEISAQAVL